MKNLLLTLLVLLAVSCGSKSGGSNPSNPPAVEPSPIEYNLAYFYDLNLAGKSIHILNLDTKPLATSTDLSYSVDGNQCDATIILQKMGYINTYHIQFVNVSPVNQYVIGAKEDCEVFKGKTYWIDVLSDNLVQFRM